MHTSHVYTFLSPLPLYNYKIDEKYGLLYWLLFQQFNPIKGILLKWTFFCLQFIKGLLARWWGAVEEQKNLAIVTSSLNRQISVGFFGGAALIPTDLALHSWQGHSPHSGGSCHTPPITHLEDPNTDPSPPFMVLIASNDGLGG